VNYSIKVIIVILFLAFAQASNAQLSLKGSESKDFKLLVESTTLFVLQGDSIYDSKLKSAVSKYWNVTSFDFIKARDINTHIKDKTKSFVIWMTIRDPKSLFKYKRLSLIVGGEDDISEYGLADVVACAPINNFGEENTFSDCIYRLDYMVKGINDMVVKTKAEKMRGGMIIMPGLMANSISRDSKGLKEKTLVVNADDRYIVDVVYDSEEFKKYPYKFLFVSKDEYREILAGNSDEYFCLLTIFEYYKHIIVYQPSTRKTVYYNFKTALYQQDLVVTETKLTSGDVKSLIESINNPY
jgi:hypothetical protein